MHVQEGPQSAVDEPLRLGTLDPVSRRGEQQPGATPSGSGSILPVVERVVLHRHVNALASVDKVRAAYPDADADQLATKLIRKYSNEMAVSGAITGGAAAAPVAGVAVAAASAGVDATVSVTRMGEMIMAIAEVYGHDSLTVDERRAAIVTIMGIADSAAISVSGLAARAGSKGGARLLRRLPTTAAGPGAGRATRMLSKATSTKGPWGLAALLPYGIGAGVGAAGSVLLTRAVGRAAKEYFSGRLQEALRAGVDEQQLINDLINDQSAFDDEIIDVTGHELDPDLQQFTSEDDSP